MTKLKVVTNTLTGSPGASDRTNPPTAAVSANTVDQHNKRKGATAGKVLYQVIEGMASTHTILPTEFIPGHSAGIR